MSQHWSTEEVEAIVADHLQMLTLELAGQTYSKTEHRRRLQAKLNNRSDGSIEFKHCNISAVLIRLGIPYIRGYQPRANYQAMLAEVVADQLKQRSMLDQAALAAVQQPAVTPLGADFAHTLTQAPARQLRVAEAQPEWQWNKPAIKRDYLEREAQNQSLGLAGEEFVLQFEHWRLNALGQSTLADRVEHVAQSQGDGLGFDVCLLTRMGGSVSLRSKQRLSAKTRPFSCRKTN